MGLFRQSSLYLCGRIVPALIGVGGVAVYTRLVDPSSMGTFALLLSTSLLAGAIGFSWLRIAALRVAAGTPGELEPDFSATIGLLFIATAIAVGLIEALAVHLYAPATSPALILLAVAAAIASAWYDLNANLLQARLNVVGWGTLNLVRAVVAVACSVALILAGFKTEGLLGGFVLGNLATVAFMKLWQPALRGRFDRALFWRCFHFGWPQSINAAQSYVVPVVQRWMLQLAAGSAAVGIFAVAQDFSTQTIASLVGSISLAGIPLAFKAKEQGDPFVLTEQLRANARLIFGMALPATAGFAILAEPISHAFFGVRFWAGAPLILTLVGLAALAINLRVYYFDQAFELAMQTRPQALISLAGSAVAVGATFALVPHYAAAGAAGAALGGSLVALALSIAWGARILRMPVPLDDWLRTALATAGMGLCLAFVPKEISTIGLAAALCGGALVYVLLSSATRLALIRAHFGGRFAKLERS
jgi:O-antigen/teichoic acid export membrane protein